ncbi:hypothetical protein HQ531_05505 [bacterium]|nr:hypothetical protein [bacterium]
MAKNSSDSSSSQVIDYLKDLDQRVSKLEALIKPHPLLSKSIDIKKKQGRGDGKPDEFEIRVGEYWFAYVGIVVLVAAFTFMLSLPWENLHAAIPSLIGLAICGGMMGFAHYFKLSYKFISLQLWSAAYFISFISILRLFHFTDHTLLSPGYLENSMLTLLTAGLVAMAHRKRSIYLSAVSLTIVLAAGIVINLPVWTLSLNSLVALGVVYYSRELKSPITFVYGSIVVYTAHLIWMLGNPIMTGNFDMISNPLWDYTYLLVYVTILSMSIILPIDEERSQDYVIANALINGTLAFILFNVLSYFHVEANPLIPKIFFFIVFFGLALLFWKRLKINFSMVFFTLLAHGTISIGLIQSVASPNLYVILIWQSLLMLINAMWFKSKFILVSNFLLYIILFLAYSAASGFAGIISVSFGFVALLSARVIRAFEDRLAWSFDILINFYLAITFFSLPFALWKAIPSEWVAFAWLGVSVLYYFMSALLKSPRYRWMGHWTLITTASYVVLLATIGMETGIRILTFLALGFVLLTVSVAYTRIRKRKMASTVLKQVN